MGGGYSRTRWLPLSSVGERQKTRPSVRPSRRHHLGLKKKKKSTLRRLNELNCTECGGGLPLSFYNSCVVWLNLIRKSRATRRHHRHAAAAAIVHPEKRAEKQLCVEDWGTGVGIRLVRTAKRRVWVCIVQKNGLAGWGMDGRRLHSDG